MAKGEENGAVTVAVDQAKVEKTLVETINKEKFYTYQDVARELGTSEASVRGLFSRSMRKLVKDVDYFSGDPISRKCAAIDKVDKQKGRKKHFFTGSVVLEAAALYRNLSHSTNVKTRAVVTGALSAGVTKAVRRLTGGGNAPVALPSTSEGRMQRISAISDELMQLVEAERTELAARLAEVDALKRKLEAAQYSRQLQLPCATETKPLTAEQLNELTGKQDLAFKVGEAARILRLPGVGQNRLFAILRELRCTMGANLPTSAMLRAGYLSCTPKIVKIPGGSDRKYSQLLITGKGLVYFKKRISEELARNPLLGSPKSEQESWGA